MNYSLNWTDDVGGVVINDRYPDGRSFSDETLKPVIAGTTNYESINYNEEMGDFFVTVNGTIYEMDEDQKAATRDTCIAFVDPFELTEEQKLEKAKGKQRTLVTATFDIRVLNIDPTALPHEMVSWRKQESEARAWDADNNAPTPMIDILLVERDRGETKQELVTKIITNADAYLSIYAGYLGRYQKAMRLIDEATTEEEVTGVEF